jgi:acid phosphatase
MYRVVHGMESYSGEHYNPRQVSPSSCAFGQLTDKGKRTCVERGAAFRRRYVDELHLLPPVLDVTKIHVQSTEIPRAIESVQSFLTGLYAPGWRRGGPEGVIDLHVRNPAREILYPKFSCGHLTSIYKYWLTQSPARQELEKRIERVTSEHPEAFAAVSAQGRRLTPHGLFDEAASRSAHNMPLPASWTPELVQECKEIATDEWFGRLRDAPEDLRRRAAQLSMGPLIRDMATRLDVLGPRDDSHHPAVSIYSGHDSTVAPLMNALEVFDGKWPDFAANLTMELLEVKKQAGEASGAHVGSKHAVDRLADRFVRVRYNGEPVAVPLCAEYAPASDPTLCPAPRMAAIFSLLAPPNEDHARACKEPFVVPGEGEKKE